jgi:hypothetical protein
VIIDWVTHWSHGTSTSTRRLAVARLSEQTTQLQVHYAESTPGRRRPRRLVLCAPRASP